MSLNNNSTLNKIQGDSVPIALYRGELPRGSPNASIHLLVRVQVANFDVQHILVDQGSSVYIMYSQLLSLLHIDKTH